MHITMLPEVILLRCYAEVSSNMTKASNLF